LKLNPAPKARNAKAWGNAPGKSSQLLSAESAKYRSPNGLGSKHPTPAFRAFSAGTLEVDTAILDLLIKNSLSLLSLYILCRSKRIQKTSGQGTFYLFRQNRILIRS
jgi:hypothetical protein